MTRSIPAVSVVIPCYNYVRYLNDAISSVLSQDGVDVDVTVVDDASTDGSPELAREWAGRDSRVRLFAHQSNHGHIRTFNEALGHARSEYVVKLDADDLLPPGSLARSTALLDRHPDMAFAYGYGLIFSGPVPTDVPTAVRSHTIWSGTRWLHYRAKRVRSVILQPEAIIRNSALEVVGGHRAQLPAASDLNLWLRLASIGSVGRVNGPVQGLYRVHETSMQRTIHSGKLADYKARIDAFTLFVEEPPGPLCDPARFRREATRALARDGIRLAFEGFDFRDESRETITSYLTIAKELDPTIVRTAGWRSIQRMLNRGVTLTPRLSIGRLRRDVRARVRWRVWRRYGL